MSTKKIFEQDSYKKETDCIVVSIKNINGNTAIILNQTIFFPTGGGQSCDTGYIGDYSVIDVYEEKEDDGEIIHILDTSVCNLNPGQPIHIKINWERRFKNMQRHLGEHILTGAFYNLYGGNNKGFHMGSNWITIDIQFSKNSPYKNLTPEMLRAGEEYANRVLNKDVPVTVDFFSNKKEASLMPVRKPVAFEKDISIVTVQDNETVYDCVACCGTHPSSSGQVGMIKIYKAEPNKGMTRVYFDAGSNVLTRYQRDLDTLTAVSDHYSSGIDELIEKIRKKEQKDARTRDQLNKLSSYVIEQTEKEIQTSLNTDSSTLVNVFEFDILDTNSIAKIGNTLSSNLDGLLLLIDKANYTVLLFSNSHINCASLIKDNAPECGGRGGGKASEARAIFNSLSDTKKFVFTIKSLIE